MLTPKTTDSDSWNSLLDEAFGAEQSAAQAEQPTEAALSSPPEPHIQEEPEPQKRRWWPFLAAALVLIAAALILFWSKNALPAELQMCKDALAQWQSYESYRIMVQHSQYGDTMVTPGYEEYLRYGDNRIAYRHSIADAAAAPTFSGTMLKDGQYYQFYAAGDFDQDPLILWQPTTRCETLLEPWPMQFNWNNDKIFHHQTQHYDSGAVKTVQLTINETASNGAFFSYSPFTAYFDFLETGILATVTLHLVSRGSGRYETAGLRVITYMPTSFDSDQIKEEFSISVSSNANS